MYHHGIVPGLPDVDFCQESQIFRSHVDLGVLFGVPSSCQLCYGESTCKRLQRDGWNCLVQVSSEGRQGALRSCRLYRRRDLLLLLAEKSQEFKECKFDVESDGLLL